MDKVNKIYASALAFLLLFPCLLAAKNIAVLETSVPENALTAQEQSILTEAIQQQAASALPAEQDWTIIRENNNADYVVQTRVSLFGQTLAVSAELYEGPSNKLIASFAGTGETVADLERVINEQAPAFFKKIQDNSWSAFGNSNTTQASADQAQPKLLVEITTNPAGVQPSLDGIAISDCQATPCKIQLDAGPHQFTFSKENFNQVDTTIVIYQGNQNINIALVPSLGYLNMVPQIPDEFRSKHAISLSIDGKKANLGLNSVTPGIHSAHIEHPCFDPIELNTIIQKDETKNIADSLIRGMGGLELDVTKNGEPQNVPVFIDGNPAGTTPFASDVPLCSKIEIEYAGERREVPVTLKWHLVIKKSFELEKTAEVIAAETRQKAEGAYDELDNMKSKSAKKPIVVAKKTTKKSIYDAVDEAAAKEAKAQPTNKANTPKRLWGGFVIGALYNDYYDTEFGLNSIPQGKKYNLSVEGAENLLDNFWGVGFKAGFGLMFMPNTFFNVRGDVNVALRQGTGKANTSVILSWKDKDLGEEKSDLKLEYTVTQLNIDIPLLARVSIPNSVYFEVGPMFSFNVYSQSESKITDIYGSEKFTEDGGLNAFEFDIATGIGVMRNIGSTILDIDLRFVIGMTRISSSKDSPKTWQGQLNITYWFL